MGETQLIAGLTGWGSAGATAPPWHVWKTFPTATSENRGALLCAVSGLALSTSSQICRSSDAQHPDTERGFICKCLSGLQERAVLAHIAHSSAVKTAAVPQKCAAADTNTGGIDWLQQSLSGTVLLVGFYETGREFMAAHHRS